MLYGLQKYMVQCEVCSMGQVSLHIRQSSDYLQVNNKQVTVRVEEEWNLVIAAKKYCTALDWLRDVFEAEGGDM